MFRSYLKPQHKQPKRNEKKVIEQGSTFFKLLGVFHEFMNIIAPKKFYGPIIAYLHNIHAPLLPHATSDPREK
jgi:hypothetical protein